MFRRDLCKSFELGCFFGFGHGLVLGWFAGHDVDFSKAYPLAAAIIQERYGVIMPEHPWQSDDRLPDGVPFEDWVELLGSTLDTVKQTSRLPHTDPPENLTDTT